MKEKYTFASILSQLLGGMGLAVLALFYWNPFEQPMLRNTVRVQPRSLDFGLLSALDVGRSTVVLTNDGHEPIEYSFSFECSCTHAEPSQGRIDPGGSVPILVNYKPRGTQQTHSIHEETAIVQLSLRNAKSYDTLVLATKAEIMQPFTMDSRETNLAANAFGATPFEFHLNLRQDVERVIILSKPDFFSELSLGEGSPESTVLTLNGLMVPPESPSKTSVELGVAIKSRGNDPLRMSLPIQVTIREPFKVTETLLRLRELGSASVTVTPVEGCEKVSVIDAKCDLPGVAIQVTGETIQATASRVEKDSTGYLHLSLLCHGKSSTEKAFSKYIAVQLLAENTPGP